MKTRVFLGIGSNIEPMLNIDKAKLALTAAFPSVQFSRTFESQAVGFDGDNFYNLVAEMVTEQSLTDLIEKLKDMENELGRQRGAEKFSSRHIDIDILLFGELVCSAPIELPRPEINENAYVLWPLAELAGELIDPVSRLSYAQLWRDFDKSSQSIKAID